MLLIRLLVLLLLFTITACQSSKTIVNGVDERDANEIVVLLAQDDITAFKIEEKASGPGGGAAKEVLWDIAVSPDEAERAMATLAQNGLPRVRSPSLLDLFSSSGLVPSDVAEKIRYRQGLADEIANMIRKMDGVVDAEVQLSFPQEDVLNPNAKMPPITASVFVKHTGILNDPNAHLISKIKQLVSGAISGLSYDNVTVIPVLAKFAIPTSTIIQISQKEYTTAFGFVVAKTSATKFYVFLLSIFALTAILILTLILFFWKCYPILKRRGGIKMLFHITPLPRPLATDHAIKADQKQEPTKPS